MITKSLHFGKALSAALLVLLLAVGTTKVFAQTQVATLQHGDDIDVFYGPNAFVEAHSAAETGDVITLSGGTFNPCTITKAITLHGAGMKPDTIAGTMPTIISGSFNIEIPANDNENLTMEGIRNNNQILYRGVLENPTFVRCQFNKIENYTTTSEIHNATFNNCIVTERLTMADNSHANCINSIIWDPTCKSQTLSSFYFVNCIVYKKDPRYIYSTTLYSCIILHFDTGFGSGSYGLPASNNVYYCASIRGGDIFFNFSNGTNWTYVNCSSLFKTFYHDFVQQSTIAWSDTYSFRLTEEAQSLYVGADGDQIGIYGGYLPFSDRPSYMVLKRCNVANKSTIDGKLSVEIEVVTDEE